MLIDINNRLIFNNYFNLKRYKLLNLSASIFQAVTYLSKVSAFILFFILQEATAFINDKLYTANFLIWRKRIIYSRLLVYSQIIRIF